MADQPPTQVSSSDTTPPNTGRLVGEHAHRESPFRPYNEPSETASAAVGTAHTLQPGEVCTTCSRKVPHPRKTDSPTSKTVAYKVPVDELGAHHEVLEAAVAHVGAEKTPFAMFKTVTAALAVLLQDEGAKGLHG